MDIDPLKYHPNLTPEQIKGYLEGKLSVEETRLVEEILLDQPFESEAMEGLEMLGADKMDAMLADIHSDIDIIAQGPSAEIGTQGLDRRSTSGTAKIRTLSTTRWISIAAILTLIVGAIWILQLSPDDTEVAFNKTQDSILEKPNASSQIELNKEIEEDKKLEEQSKAKNNTGWTEEDDDFIQIIDGGVSTEKPVLIEKDALPAKEEISSKQDEKRLEVINQTQDLDLEETYEDEPATLQDAVDQLTDDEVIPAEGSFAFNTLGNTGNNTNSFNREYQADTQLFNKKELDGKLYIPPTTRYELEGPQGLITGRVTSQAGDPIFGAAISVGGGLNVVTNYDGYFEMPVTTGSQFLNAQFIGFEDYSEVLLIGSDEERELNIELIESDLALNEVAIAQSDKKMKAISSIPAQAELENYSGYSNSSRPPAITGKGYYNKGDYSNALNQFEIQLQIDPNNSELLLLAGNCHLELGNPEAAAAQLELLLLQIENKYTEQAKWYMANAKLQLYLTVEAKVLLQELVDIKGKYRKEAINLLESLD
ncbi:MAG: hypothetical protein ACI959_000711 [Limisphaerales bacterium]